VLNRRVPGKFLSHLGATVSLSAALLAGLAPRAFAQDAVPAVSVGAGVRTSFVHNSPQGGSDTDNFFLDNMRLYVSGTAAPKIKFMFNTDYTSTTNDLNVLDAAGQFELSPAFNVWVGRFLPPSDRANLYGPFYAHHWGVYTDGVQDGYPFIYQGRDTGAVYWGQFGKVKVSGGVFDGASLNGENRLLTAARVQVDFWDPEGGYYLNGTYYGDKNLLAVGLAAQEKGSGKTAVSADFLLERKVGTNGAAFSVESEWARYDHLGGYSNRYGVDQGAYILGSYLLPKTPSVTGQFEVLAKYAFAQFRQGITSLDVNFDQKTTEINFNYVIRQFNARVMAFFKDTRFTAVRANFKQFGVALQLQI